MYLRTPPYFGWVVVVGDEVVKPGVVIVGGEVCAGVVVPVVAVVPPQALSRRTAASRITRQMNSFFNLLVLLFSFLPFVRSLGIYYILERLLAGSTLWIISTRMQKN
jgi:hypothetical protein